MFAVIAHHHGHRHTINPTGGGHTGAAHAAQQGGGAGVFAGLNRRYYPAGQPGAFAAEGPVMGQQRPLVDENAGRPDCHQGR